MNHYKIIHIQYIDFSLADNKMKKKNNLFVFDGGYTLEPPWCGSSNEYPQSVFSKT